MKREGKEIEFKDICLLGLTLRKTKGGTSTDSIMRAKPPDVATVSVLVSESPDEERTAKLLTGLNSHGKAHSKMFTWIKSTAEIHFSYGYHFGLENTTGVVEGRFADSYLKLGSAPLNLGVIDMPF